MTQINKTLPLWRILLCGAAIVTLSMGVRHGFGLWLQPITQAQNWTRENFAFALAIQNLTWGFFGIFSGMAADKFGAFRVMVGCALIYTLGLLGMAYAPSTLLFTLSAGVLVGIALAGTSFPIIFGIIGRNESTERRSWAMGMAAAGGSFGQFLMVPVEGLLIANFGWQEALNWLALAMLLAVPLAFLLREPSFEGGKPAVRDQSIVQAVREAFAYRSFQLLMAGFFVCGFQVVFIGVHMPSYLKDKGLSPEVASISLALIGLFNIFGTYIAGSLGQRMAKCKILAFIYISRSVAITLFLLAPLTPWSVYIFSSVIGLLWLSTIPPTNSVIAQIFGISHLSMLGGLVFLSHQIGSFLGVWMGGYLFDKTGSYDVVWYSCIALGLFAALVNLPIKEATISRQPKMAPA